MPAHAGRSARAKRLRYGVNTMLPLGLLFAYRLPAGLANAQRVRFHQEVWGQTTSSWGGRYHHHRRGFMEDVPHRKLRAGVFLTPLSEGERVRAFLAPRVAHLLERKIVLEPEDARAFERG